MQISHFKWILFWFLLIFLPHNSISQKCTFTIQDLPIPADPLIVGDVRKNPECQSTTFNHTLPTSINDQYYNPNNIRIFTREEYVMGVNSSRYSAKKAMGKYYSSGYFLAGYHLQAQSTHRYTLPLGTYSYIQVPKTGSSAIKATMGVFQHPSLSHMASMKLTKHTFATIRFSNNKKRNI